MQFNYVYPSTPPTIATIVNVASVIINCLREMLGISYDAIVLLSGYDFPIIT